MTVRGPMLDTNKTVEPIEITHLPLFCKTYAIWDVTAAALAYFSDNMAVTRSIKSQWVGFLLLGGGWCQIGRVYFNEPLLEIFVDHVESKKIGGNQVATWLLEKVFSAIEKSCGSARKAAAAEHLRRNPLTFYSLLRLSETLLDINVSFVFIFFYLKQSVRAMLN
jgi:hypothetical protein